MALHLLVESSILDDHVEWLVEVPAKHQRQLRHVRQVGLDHDLAQHICPLDSPCRRESIGLVYMACAAELLKYCSESRGFSSILWIDIQVGGT